MEEWALCLVLVAGACAQWNGAASPSLSSSSSSLASASSLTPSGGGTCDISEFRCSSKTQDGQLCLPMDRWCNGNVDCDNRVDEPRSCTICNRTYYGRLGATYRLSLVRPRLSGPGSNGQPWQCWLNFTALGGHHGDRVLIGWEFFSVGQLSTDPDGRVQCTGGHVTQVDPSNSGRQSSAGAAGSGGAWCGEGFGQPVTTSEGKWLQLQLSILDVMDLSRFRFDLTYRFVGQSPESLPQSAGSLVPSHFHGDLVPGTVCSRNLHSCDQQQCVIQSPNFPGLYPRNVTCYYYIRQTWAPRNESVLISVGQERAQFFSVRTSREEMVAKLDGGAACRSPDQGGDALTIYGGATTESPVLARLCGTGPIPYVTGAGGQMLVVFRSSAFDAPFNPASLGSNPGFHLNVRVHFSPRLSQCLTVIKSSHQRQGHVTSPDVTLPADTTCRYQFQAKKNERIWLTFLAYHLEQHNQQSGADNCLTLMDGQDVLLKECGPAAAPRLCPQAIIHNSTRSRPCRPQDEESYLSQSNSLVMEQRLGRGTALDKWSFSLRYEFVRVDQFDPPTAIVERPLEHAEEAEDELVARPEVPGCFHLIDGAKGNGSVTSPRNTFLYGRGGSRDLDCLYRFRAASGQHINLTINTFHESGCSREGGGWSQCQSCLIIDEIFWNRVRRRSYQTCRSQTAPVYVDSSAPLVELTFQVRNMSWFQDDDHFYFVAEYFFTSSVPEAPADSSALDADCWRRHQQTGKRGLMRIHPADPCIRRRIPWYIEAPKSGHLLLQLPAGTAVLRPKLSAASAEEECLTDNRLFVYSISDGQARIYREICLCGPDSGASSGQSLYSPGWSDRDWFDGLLVVASLQGREADGPVTVPWLAVFKDATQGRKSPAPPVNNSGSSHVTLMTCRTGCPVLGVCLSAESWCDDHVDCPDGADEADCVRLIYWPLWVGLVLILLLVGATGVVYAHLKPRCHTGQQRYHVARKYKQQKCPDKFSSVTVNLTKGYEKSGPGS